jgi:D-alanyl-D-alanine carboxypeptidase
VSGLHDLVGDREQVAADLGYQTKCGTVYGHTGNIFGYTQFIAASKSGSRSVVVSINAQITPKDHPARFRELRRIDTLAVCAALVH